MSSEVTMIQALAEILFDISEAISELLQRFNNATTPGGRPSYVA